MKIKKRRDKGVALFIVLSLLFLLSIGGAIILLLAYNYTYTTKKQVERIRAFYLAEAGITYAFWALRTGNPIDSPIKPDPNGPDVEITVTGPSGGLYSIRSKVVY